MSKEEVMRQFPLPRRPLHPWLFCKYGSVFQHSIFFKITSPVRRKHKILEELGNERVVSCSPDGCWLLLALFVDSPVDDSTTENYFAFNPTTMESIDLPCVMTDGIEYGVFSSSPTDPKCLVLLFVRNRPLILYCRVGDSCFSVFNYEESMIAQTGRPDVQRRYLLGYPVGFDGKIYAIGSWDNSVLVQITVDESNNCHTSLISRFGSYKFPSRFILTRKFLVALGDQDLFQIHIFKKGSLGIGIYQFNFSTNSWENTTSLNGRSMFLSSQYSLSVDDTPNKDWSYIYFSDSTDDILYSYRVEDERMSYFPPIDLPHPFCCNLPYSWIMLADQDMIIHNEEDIIIHNQEDDMIEENIIASMCFPAWLTEEDPKNCSSKLTEVDKKYKNCSIIMDSFTETKKKRIKGKPSRYGQPLLLCDLSKDLLGLIAGKLSFVDYMNFRCVNKDCASSTIKMRMNPFPPCLIYFDRANGEYNIVDSKLNRKLSAKSPHIIKDYEIRCSRNGWLLMENDGAIVFFNPFTMETITGPRCKESFEIANFSFVSKPSCSDCEIMLMALIASSTGKFLGIYTAQPPRIGGEWREFLLERLDQEKFIHGCISPVFLNGSCYYLGENGKLGRFQTSKDGGFEWKIPVQLTAPLGQKFLTECGGDLVSIFMVGRREVHVFKLKDDNWEQINTLGSYSIYVSWSSSISAIAETPEMADRIYFTRFYRNGLVYFSLKTKKLHSTGCEHSLSDLVDTSKYCNCAWIEPSWG